ncbi:hypothetical protein [Rhodobacter sp. CZR27]|uniref:hypothetical protein n=1 Tax=Rhodobacter sp. CZR27 TaxID=2033869 RepID=UPI000BBED8C3|nr:hypothetical protein [Rhodobacter sp. CZR27]
MRASGVIMVMGALSACASQAPVAGRAIPGASEVTVEGQRFLTELRAGPTGERLTADGAQPVAGLSVDVRRLDPPLHYSDGAAAKRAAEAACAGQGGRFDPTAVGRVSAPNLWRFAGACA